MQAYQPVSPGEIPSTERDPTAGKCCCASTAPVQGLRLKLPTRLSAKLCRWELQHLNVGTSLCLPELQEAEAFTTPVMIYSVNPSPMKFKTAILLPPNL